ncbi:MAG: hydroxymethylglutaryl-CoA lyase [Chloroflexota bacterium]
MPRRVRVVEVGPRDGLQNEAGFVPTGAKVRFIELLSEAGFEAVETTSFVSPRAVPQLADAEEVFRAIRRRPGVRYPVLVPNLKGLERALKAGAREVAVFTAASETFNLKNINMSIDRSLEVIADVVREARAAGLWVRGYISVCFGCPYEGKVDPEKVLTVAARLAELGVAEVSLGDTIGVATPRQVEETVGRVLKELPAERLALHFHDTRGTALANVLTGLLMGISVFDSSAGGLGGCPFAPGASGNLATEDLLYLLHGMGVETGVDLAKVMDATRYILGVLNRPPASRYFQACQTAAVP